MLIFKLVETLLVQGITQVETANLDVSPKPGARKMEMVCRDASGKLRQEANSGDTETGESGPHAVAFNDCTP